MRRCFRSYAISTFAVGVGPGPEQGPYEHPLGTYLSRSTSTVSDSDY